uniref:hypothetical protein n=1 Tax=Bacillus sp. MMSF_3328 TaxID=3047080 RepID=UPI00273E7373
DTVEHFNKKKILHELNDMVFDDYPIMGIVDEYEWKQLEEARYYFLLERNFIPETLEETLQETGATKEEDDFGF